MDNPAPFTYSEIIENVEAYRPRRMTNAEAADLLLTLKHTSNIVSGKTGEAIDRAIAVLQPEIVPTLENLLDAVIQETGVPQERMQARSRCRDYSDARYIYCYLAHKYTNASYTEIGSHINREHVMVYYGIHKVKGWLDNPKINPDGAKLVQQIMSRVKVDG